MVHVYSAEVAKRRAGVFSFNMEHTFGRICTPLRALRSSLIVLTFFLIFAPVLQGYPGLKGEKGDKGESVSILTSTWLFL